MGLDMYLEGRKTFTYAPDPPRLDRRKARALTLELGYWRSRHDLHTHISRNYPAGGDLRNGKRLEAGDLRRLVYEVRGGELGDRQSTITILERAIKWLETPPKIEREHREVYYRAEF